MPDESKDQDRRRAQDYPGREGYPSEATSGWTTALQSPSQLEAVRETIEVALLESGECGPMEGLLSISVPPILLPRATPGVRTAADAETIGADSAEAAHSLLLPG